MAMFKDKKLTQADGESLVNEIAPDLIAYYKLLESAVMELLIKSQDENWAPDKLIMEIESLFE